MSVVYMYEAQLRQKSLSNQTAFCWPTQRICVTKLNTMQNLYGEISCPHVKLTIVWFFLMEINGKIS